MKLTCDEAISRLQKAGLKILAVTPIQHGNQIKLSGGGNINVYSTGKVLLQGKNPDPIHAALFEIHAVTPYQPAAQAPIDPPQAPSALRVPNTLRINPAVLASVNPNLAKRHLDWSDNPDEPGVPF